MGAFKKTNKMNTKYMFKFKDDTNTAFEYEAASLDEAVIQAEHEVKLRGVEVAVYKLMFSSLPPETIDHAEKHLDEIIEEPSRTLSQNMSDNLSKIREMLRKIREENLEGLRILTGITPDKPTSNVITNRPFIHPGLLGVETAPTVHTLSDIVREPGEPLAYEMYQRRVEFLSNFENGRKLYNENALFHTITELIMRGANVYELLLELVFMQDGLCTPETSHLIDICNMDSPGADAPNKKI